MHQIGNYCDKRGKPTEKADIEKEANSLKSGESDFTKAMGVARKILAACAKNA